MDNEKNLKLKAYEFLCDNRYGVVSTVSYNASKPQSSVVYYAVDEKFIYFITPLQSRKLGNMNQNNNIAFTIFTEIPPMELQLEGTVESVDEADKETKKRITDIYLENANKQSLISRDLENKNSETINWPPVLKVPNDEGFVYVKITINWFKFSDFSNQESRIVEGTPADWA